MVRGAVSGKGTDRVRFFNGGMRPHWLNQKHETRTGSHKYILVPVSCAHWTLACPRAHRNVFFFLPFEKLRWRKLQRGIRNQQFLHCKPYQMCSTTAIILIRTWSVVALPTHVFWGRLGIRSYTWYTNDLKRLSRQSALRRFHAIA